MAASGIVEGPLANGLTGVFYDYESNPGITLAAFATAEVESQFCADVSILNFEDTQPGPDPMDFFVTGDGTVLPPLGIEADLLYGDFFTAPGTNEEVFAAKFCGEIDLPGGEVEFSIKHDDGVVLYIDDEQVLIFDAPANGVTTTGTFFRDEPGTYDIKIVMFENFVEANLVFKWNQGPGGAFELVPTEVLHPVQNNKEAFCNSPLEPLTTSCGGDPHFTRWGQSARDSFHGECDLVLAHSENFYNGAGLDVHVRTTMHDFYSYIESAAVKIGNHVLEVEKGNFVLGGTPLEDSDLPLIFGDEGQNFKFELVKKTESRTNYRLDFGNKSGIVFKFYKQFLNIDIIGHDDLFDNKGLLGSYPNGDMISRGGVVMTQFEDYGFEWQVSPEDPKLFGESREPQLPYEKCRVPTASRPARRHLRAQNRKLLAEAEQACASQQGSNFELCVDDVMMTGDIGLAEDW